MITRSLFIGFLLIPLLLLKAQSFNESDFNDGSQHVKPLLDPKELAGNESVIVVSFLSAISQIPEEVGDLLRVFSQSRQVSSSGDSSSTFESKHASTVGNLHSCFRTDFDGSMIAGALKVAVDDINERDDILPNHILHYIFKNTCGDEQISTQAFMDHWKMGARVFIGPESNCRTEAQMAAAQNLPIISYKCRDKMVSDKKKYMTFSRTAPAETDITRAFVTMMKEFKWHKFSVIYESTTQANRELMEAVRDAVETENKKAFDDDGSKYVIQNISDLHQFSEINEKFDSTLEQIIEQTRKNTRIYVTFGSVRLFRRILQIMGKKGMMETQEFIIIYLDPDYNWLDPYHAMNNHFVRNTMVDLLTSWDGENSTDKYTIPYLKNALAIIPTPMDYTSEKFVKFWNRSTQYLNYFGVYKNRDQRWSVRYNRFACYLYDAMMLYAKGLHQLVDLNTDRSYDPTRDGIEITKRITGSYESICGFTMTINENHDAKGNYTLLSWQTVPNRTDKSSTEYYPFNHALDVTGVFIEDENGIPKIRFNKPMQWTDGVPKDQPECGFNDELCAGASVPIAYATFFLVCGFTIVGIGLGGYCSIKNKNVEKELHSIWMIDANEITNYTKDPTGSVLNLFTDNREFMDGSEPDMRQLRDTGLYKGQNIWIKELTYQNKKQKEFSRKLKIEMRTMRQLNCANVNAFLGIFVRQQSVCVVREYCPRGSLMDILQNKELKLDKVFVASFLDDLIKGMMYIHDTDLGIHGNLKSTNCLITSRWVLQVADFGLGELREGRVWPSERARWDSLLWTAPEILRESQFGTAPFKPTKQADIYAFGVILHEMLYRNGPYGCMVQNGEPEVAVSEVIKMAAEGNHPHIGHAVYITPALADTMKRCFRRPPDRPDFKSWIRTTLRAHLNEQKKKNIMDHMLDMMDKYQETLEDTIKERAAELKEEQMRSEKLLERMLPAAVASQLLQGVGVEPEAYPAVSIYFSDIVGFTRISGESDPIEVVKFLNKLYTLFDDIIQQYNVYKVETIGDAYMVVSGVPTFKNRRVHAEAIAVMALHLLKAVQNFTIPHLPKEKLLLRIGIHTGPCVGGIVGTTMPRFCLFGDTVNTASRMESNGEPLKIHISEATKGALEETKGEPFFVQTRGNLLIKGKGEMTTYWLTGRAGLHFDEIPDPVQPAPALPAPDIFPRSSAVKSKLGSFRQSTLSLKDFSFMRKHDKPTANIKKELPIIDSPLATFSTKNGGVVSVGSSYSALASVNEEGPLIHHERSRDRRRRPFAMSLKNGEPLLENEVVLRKRSTSLPDAEKLSLVLEGFDSETRKESDKTRRPPDTHSLNSGPSPSPSQYPSYKDLRTEVQRKRGMMLTVWPSRKRSLSVGDVGDLPELELIHVHDKQHLLEDKRKTRHGYKDRKSVLSLHSNFFRDVSPLAKIRDASPFGRRTRAFWRSSTTSCSLTSSNCSSSEFLRKNFSLDVVFDRPSRGESLNRFLRRFTNSSSSEYTGLTNSLEGSDEHTNSHKESSNESFENELSYVSENDCGTEPLISSKNQPELMV